MVAPLDSPQPLFDLLSSSEIPDNEEDVPIPGPPPNVIGPLQLPVLIFGAAAFSAQYNTADHISGTTPLRTVRLALRYGIRAFDTSAYYGPSEIVLGNALKALEHEFPRSSYQLTTKCGRYGLKKAEFDYRPETIRRSIQRSLSRLHTDYLDTVYLHDVEFVCTQVQLRTDGNHIHALDTESAAYGLAEGQEGKVWGEGDQDFLDAVAELRKLKAEGLIKHIGITGYPLPVLLRLALLVLHTAPYEPLDVLLNYSHLNLQNATFVAFVPAFRDRARIGQLITASPLNMGLLTPAPPSWSPAPPALRRAVQEADEMLAKTKSTLVDVALGYAYREAKEADLPTVVGLSRPSEVHETMRVWRELQNENSETSAERLANEKLVQTTLSDYVDYSWASP